MKIWSDFPPNLQALESICDVELAPTWEEVIEDYRDWDDNLGGSNITGVYNPNVCCLITIFGGLGDAFFFAPYSLGSQWKGWSAQSDYAHGKIVIKRSVMEEWGYRFNTTEWLVEGKHVTPLNLEVEYCRRDVQNYDMR